MEGVFVGLSGGVDSAVSAALLKERGYDVVGCFIKIWQPEFIECTWREDRLDAMRVCAALGIPFREIDLSEEYKREVVEPMITDYARGITPNPDVLCNKSIKFGHFARWAFAEGAEKIATGHYARVGEEDFSGKHFATRTLSEAKQVPQARNVCRRNPTLLRGKDTNKDQSYFLHQIETETLARTMFPIGDLEKSEVRRLASHFNLPVAKKADSQGLCFVGDITMKDFLARYLPLLPGDVVDMRGEKIGTHDGAVLYTIGQRHGFRADGVQYVVAIDTARNTITTSPNIADAMSASALIADMHWINPVSLPLNAAVQSRYREIPVPACMTKDNDVVRVAFSSPHLVSPGQSLVVYDGDTCLGGGTISSDPHSSSVVR